MYIYIYTQLQKNLGPTSLVSSHMMWLDVCGGRSGEALADKGLAMSNISHTERNPCVSIQTHDKLPNRAQTGTNMPQTNQITSEQSPAHQKGSKRFQTRLNMSKQAETGPNRPKQASTRPNKAKHIQNNPGKSK